MKLHEYEGTRLHPSQLKPAEYMTRMSELYVGRVVAVHKPKSKDNTTKHSLEYDVEVTYTNSNQNQVQKKLTHCVLASPFVSKGNYCTWKYEIDDYVLVQCLNGRSRRGVIVGSPPPVEGWEGEGDDGENRAVLRWNNVQFHIDAEGTLEIKVGDTGLLGPAAKVKINKEGKVTVDSAKEVEVSAAGKVDLASRFSEVHLNGVTNVLGLGTNQMVLGTTYRAAETASNAAIAAALTSIAASEGALAALCAMFMPATAFIDPSAGVAAQAAALAAATAAAAASATAAAAVTTFETGSVAYLSGKNKLD